MIVVCQPGFEDALAAELSAAGAGAERERGGGWVATERGLSAGALEHLCFAHRALLAPVEITGDSVNALAGRILEGFLESLRGEKVEGPWPCVFEAAAGLEGLGRRVDGVEAAFREALRKRLSRVARLAGNQPPVGVGVSRGLQVRFVDFRRAYLARDTYWGGQRRMADDPLAPSRSYLKVEEAYSVLGYEPAKGETVADLGAAPGGWSYSAAKRGAQVVAVDNGPLKGGALGHPLIEHRREDAFRFSPGPGGRYDWMFCDLVEDPYHVLRNLVGPWIEKGWCRRFVVILKFGRADPVALLREVRGPASVFSRLCPGFRVRHLYHDREEFTIVGGVKGEG